MEESLCYNCLRVTKDIKRSQISSIIYCEDCGQVKPKSKLDELNFK